MKVKTIVIVIFILQHVMLCAQDYNAIRVAGGVSIASNTEAEYALRIGPSISISYARGFNQFISAETEFYSGFVNNSNTAQSVFFDFDLKCVVTPLAKVFKYLELGVGPALRYDRYTEPFGERNAEDETLINCTGVFDNQRILAGINYCIRLYAIRNSRLDLFAFYEPRTEFARDFSRYYLRSSNIGIAFGVKF